MTETTRLILLSAICLGLGMAAANAQPVPRLDVARTCRAEAAPRTDKTATDVCMADEQRAHEQLLKEWEQFTADHKRTCLELSRSFDQSYVELLTCLETAQQAAKAPKQ